MSRPGALRWLQVVLGATGLALLLAGVTATAYLHNARIDLSSGDRFTLSDHALAVLRDLDRPVRVTGFIRTEDARNPILKDLLWQVANESQHVSYTIVDVNRNPSLAAQYGVSTYGAAVVESGDKRTDFTLPVESQLIAAILHVTRPPKKLYALGGHGECSLTDSDRHSGCSGLRDALGSELYDVDTITLRGEGTGVPGDADAVLLLGPRADFLDAELDALGAYLDAGGKVFVLLDPFEAPKLAAFLASRGIELGLNVVVDPENRLGGGEPLSAAVPNLNRQHLVTATLDAPPLFSAARSVSARDDDETGRRSQWLLKSGDRSWAAHDPAVLAGASAQFVAGRDLNGPLVVGAEVWTPLRASEADGDDATASAAQRAEAGAGAKHVRGGSRIVAYGDSEFVSNRFLEYLGNRDLAVNTVNWLMREDRLMAPRARRKQPGSNWLFVSQEQLRSMFLAAVVAQPGLFLAVGLGVLLRRRLSP
jgi:ABC-type uncharacterized transport system involved in gliding motility auxiliary subunit